MFGKIYDTSEIQNLYHFLYGDWNRVVEAMCYPLLLLNLPLWIDFCALAASWICLSLSSLSASWVLMPQLWAAVWGITIWTAAPWGAVSLWPASPLLHRPALRAAKRGSIARDPDTGLGARQHRGRGGGMSVPKGCSLRWDAVVQCGQTDILK